MAGQLARDLQFFLGQYDLRLLHPQGLWLLAAVPILFVIGLWIGQDVRWWRKLPIQLLRAALVCALAIAYSQPVRVSTSKAPAVVILADLSASSAGELRAQIDQRVRQLWSARGEAPSYLVGFGLQPELLAGPGHRRVALPERPGAPGTDLAAALRFCYGLFPPDQDRRVVILSDGEQTRGDLLAEAGRAAELDIQLSVIPLAPAEAFDVRIERLSAPASLRMGEQASLEVELVANARRQARLVLQVDGRDAASRTLGLAAGSNRVDLTAELEGEGWHTLSARVQAGADRYPQNNRAAGRIWVFGQPRVLLVQQQDLPNPLRSLLATRPLRLETASPASMPTALAELSSYDLVVLDDLKLAQLGTDEAGRLRAYVEEFGGGLLVSAGQAASELADPKTAPIEALLPVEFKQVKKKEEIPAALVFVTDRSSSMARGSKFVILLRAVADTLERLKDTAQVAVIMFDDFPEVVVPLTEALQRDTIRKVLMAQRVGGGTSMYPALEVAHKQLKKSAAKLKHVILLSDGQSISLYGHYGYVVEAMVKDEITITTVALGKDADEEELKRVAGRSGGRFYATDSMDNVPKIFTAETENITEANQIEQPVRAVPAKLVQALAGIDFSSAPPLKGYLASEARPTSEVLLRSSDRSEPLLVRWRFGLGRVMVMTSDAQGGWARDWIEWPGFAELWPRLADDTLRRSPPGQLRMASWVDAGRGVVTVLAPGERPDSQAEPPRLLVLDPSGRPLELPLVRRGLGLYRTEFELRGQGSYALRAERRAKHGALEIAFGSVAGDYSDEYLSAGGNRPLLEAAARRTGGLVDPDPEAIFAPGRQEKERTQPLWPGLVLAALGLFLAEVLVRRL